MLVNNKNEDAAEFETLAADILSAEHSVTFEHYGEGPVGGIDCRLAAGPPKRAAKNAGPGATAQPVLSGSRLIQGADYKEAQRVTLVEKKLYWPLIEAENFSPRLIVMIFDQLTAVPVPQLKAAIEQRVEGQLGLWQKAFQRLSAEAQTLVYGVGMAGNNANARELKRPFNTLYLAIYNRVAPLNGFDRALLPA